MNDKAFPIVGVGASAGGIEAFHRFVEKLPPDSGMGLRAHPSPAGAGWALTLR